MQPASPDVQPPCPLQAFCPAHACLATAFAVAFLCFARVTCFALGVAGVLVAVSSAYADPERSAAENTPAEMRVCGCFIHGSSLSVISTLSGRSEVRPSFNAVAQAGRFGAILEHMPQMGVAAGAEDLGAVVPAVIGVGRDVGVVYRRKEARPAGLGIELVQRDEEARCRSRYSDTSRPDGCSRRPPHRTVPFPVAG